MLVAVLVVLAVVWMMTEVDVELEDGAEWMEVHDVRDWIGGPVWVIGKAKLLRVEGLEMSERGLMSLLNARLKRRTTAKRRVVRGEGILMVLFASVCVFVCICMVKRRLLL